MSDFRKICTLIFSLKAPFSVIFSKICYGVQLCTNIVCSFAIANQYFVKVVENVIAKTLTWHAVDVDSELLAFRVAKLMVVGQR